MKSIFFKLITTLLLINTLFANSRIRENNENIILQLQWKNKFQFAGYFIAKEKGFYKDYNIDVTIKQREYGQNVVHEILERKADVTLYNIKENGKNSITFKDDLPKK